MAQGVNTGFKTAEGAAQERNLDPLFYCGSIQSYGPTSGDAHASDAVGIDLRSLFKIIQGADHIPGPPARHSLAKHQSRPRRGLARGALGRSFPCSLVAAMAEAQLLDGEGCDALSDALKRKVILVAS